VVELIRRLSVPLAPRSVAGVLPRLKPLGGIRGVLFDVYGTLLISAAGDIGSDGASREAKCAAMAAAMRDAGLAGTESASVRATAGAQVAFGGVARTTVARPAGPAGGALEAGRLVAALEAAIRSAHAEARKRGVEHPEVELRELWRRLLPGAGTAAVERAAVSYECRVNPVWPMPGAAETVAALQARGPVGIVSNAQFFTPLVLAALLPGLRFDPRLVVWSFAEREAKPSPRLFATAAARMARYHRLPPRAIAMVGNDMRNDLLGARAAGLRTALFAGDACSLRLRRDDPHCAAVHPDLVLTNLSQLPAALRGGAV
jgi:putative hydrolase of the HAD superfamily